MAAGGNTTLSGKRVALVIGNSAYRHVAPLANPKNDAKLIASTLEGLNFTLVGGGALIDLDRAQLAKAVQDFGLALSGAEVGLFYYAGHGLQVQGVNWLVPVDANPTRPQDLDFQMVDADLVLRQMDGAGTKLNLVMLDACRNNPFGGRGLRATQGGLAEMRAPEGTLISYATQPGNVAADGDGADSVYTTALASAMTQPGVDVFRLFNQVGLEVKRNTGGAQQPWVSTSPIEGDFYFTNAPSTPQPPRAQPTVVAGLARPAPVVSDLPDASRRLMTSVLNRPCSLLDIRMIDNHAVITGMTLPGADWDRLVADSTPSRGIREGTPAVEFLPRFACAPVDMLGSIVRRTRGPDNQTLLSLPRRTLNGGETLTASLRDVGDSYVELDIYQELDRVDHVHLKGTGTDAQELLLKLPSTSVQHGTRLLSVVISPTKLPDRPETEHASSYLVALRQTIATMPNIRVDLALYDLRAPAAVAPPLSPVTTNPVPMPVTKPRPARCGAISERAQMGESPSDADRAFLRAQCR